MKVVIYSDSDVDSLEDRIALFSLLNNVLKKFSKSVSLSVYTFDYDVQDSFFKTVLKD